MNKEFYPTPPGLIINMIHKIDWKKSNYVLEPSAGNGAIVKQLRESHKRYTPTKIHCIEKDDDLRNMLIGAGEKVVGKDFLTYAGLIQFDTIIMNPPFSTGDAHLLKAIDILYSGQIVCLLNAETLKNPYSNQRRELVQKLQQLDAEIEYIQDAFLEADRKTSVEIALVTIKIERSMEEDLLEGANDRTKEFVHEDIDHEIKDVAQRDSIEAIVDDYNFRVNTGIELIHKHFVDRKYVGNYFSLTINIKGADHQSSSNSGTVQSKTNLFLEQIRHDYWEKVLSLPAFEKRLTEKKRKEFRETIKNNSDLEFTSANVRAFFENLMHSYESILIDAIEKLFDDMTIKYMWDESIHCKNTHYYNGWKSNDAFKVNKKIIIPHIGIDPYWPGSYRIGYQNIEKLNDIDKVMNYFCGKSVYIRISEVAEKADGDMFTMLESEYFKIRFYKKGTTHLTFKSEDIRRRFNIEVGKKKGWLPMDYGHTPLKQLPMDQQEIVKSFEDNPKDYDKHLGQIGIVIKELLQIAS